MPSLKIRIVGYKKEEVNSDWETHIVNSTLSSLFSGTIDGYPIDQWRIDSITPGTSLDFRNSGSVLPVNSFFTYAEVSSGLIDIIYYHSEPFGVIVLTAKGTTATYQIEFKINSIV